MPRDSRNANRRLGVTFKILSSGKLTSSRILRHSPNSPSVKAVCESDPNATQPPASRTAAATARQLSSLPLRECKNEELLISSATWYFAAAWARQGAEVSLLAQTASAWLALCETDERLALVEPDDDEVAAVAMLEKIEDIKAHSLQLSEQNMDQAMGIIKSWLKNSPAEGGSRVPAKAA